jgi:adhesin transport system outer membrane protein
MDSMQSWLEHTHANIERGWTERDGSTLTTQLTRMSLKTIGCICRNAFGWHACVLVLSLVLSGVAFATAIDNQATTPLPLSEVLTIVTRTDPEIMEALSQYRSVQSERSIATSGYWPTIGTELSGGREFTDGVDTNDERESLTASSATLYARQNLFSGGRTSAFVDETDARILAAAYEVLNVANRVYLETTEAYLNVIQAVELLRLSEENVLTQEKILEQVREKSAAGFGRASDLKNSEARLALARSNYISKQQDLNQAVVRFHRRFGRLVKPEAFVTPEPAFQFPKTVEETVAVAFRNHPALEVAEYNIQVRKYSFEKAKADDWPSIDLELKAQHRNDINGEPGDTDQYSAMLKLNYILFDGGLREGEQNKNFQSIHKENQRAYIERRNVNESVRLAWNIMQAEERKRQYLNEHVELSYETLEAFKEEYYVGRRTLLDLLNMENEYNAAKNASAESIFSNLIAYYRVSEATGMMVKEYDTGLRSYLNLPAEEQFDLERYEMLDPDRDRDSTEDVQDQCDNSIPGVLTPPSGCIEDKAIHVGYQEPTDLSPYIQVPQGTPEELNLKIDKLKPQQSFHLDTIHFASGSAELTDYSRQKLRYIAAQLKAAGNFMVEVIGHTDSVDSAQYNQALSVARAQSVYSELIRLGLEEGNLQYSGRGEQEPIATNDTKEGRLKNRRIEFKLTKKKPD